MLYCPPQVSVITQGMSGLMNTSVGSITQGTPSTGFQTDGMRTQHQKFEEGNWGTPQPNYLHHILNVHGHARSLTNSPISNPASPSLDMIQEELPHSKYEGTLLQPAHPQICVTDVLGSEVTLVAGSDTSEDSMDSLENHRMASMLPSFVISEPAENLPSITRGIGRKTSQESAIPSAMDSCKSGNEQPHQSNKELYLRRNSDKSSLCSEDDSLSNDSLSNQSPSSSSNTQCSHTYESDIRYRPLEEFDNSTQNFQIFQNYGASRPGNSTFLSSSPSRSSAPMLHKNSGSFELELSEGCSQLQSMTILEMVKRTIHDRVPPKSYQVVVANNDHDSGEIPHGESSNGLSLEYEGGIQIELKVVGRNNDAKKKGLKLRRISGDHLVYNELCQQLISCMTVSS